MWALQGLGKDRNVADTIVSVSVRGRKWWSTHELHKREARADAQSFWTLSVGKRTQHRLRTVQTDGIMAETGRELPVTQRWEPREEGGSR